MRIDAHQHFWQYEPREYPWITDRLAALRADFLPRHLSPLLDRHGFDGCVAVQARQSSMETRWLLDLSRENPWILGVVGWIDLRGAGVRQSLDALAGQKLVGVRHLVQDEIEDRFLLREDFVSGVRALAAHDLTYDVLIYPRHLEAAIAFADRVTDVRLVLDHGAKPPIATGELEPWRRHVRELARRPNVFCKLSGLVTESAWDRWRAADFDPFLDALLEAFGPKRLLFGSDWPVCLLAGQYSDVLLIAERLAGKLSPSERSEFFGGTASRAYRLSR
ncbi:MAG: amidohydrolase family protein [Planctomycetes bacterium]|nr:amidohydrolase family protein [Planctomycetota bacterium]